MKIQRTLKTLKSDLGLTDFELSLLLKYGSIENMTIEHVEGVNPDLDTAANEDLHMTGGDFTGFFASATAVKLKSGDAGDTSKGAMVCGLNASGVYTETAVTTNAANGTTEVAVPGTWLALFDVYSTEAATLAGSLLVGPAGFGSTYLTAPITTNGAAVGARQVPAGKIAFACNFYGGLIGGVASSGAGVGVFTGSATQYWRRCTGVAAGYGTSRKKVMIGPFTAGERIKLRGMNAIANNTIVNGSFDWILIDTGTTGLDA